MISEVDKVEVKKALGKFTRRQVMELDTCAHCALCTDNCPVYSESEEPGHAPGVRSSKTVKVYNKHFSLRSRLFGVKPISDDEIKDLADSAYHCTMCGRCMESCPFGFQTHELWTSVRGVVNDLDANPSNVETLGDMLEESQNPYGLDTDMRLDWADYTDLDEIPEKDQAEIAYFVGCTTAFKGANHEVAFAVASILNNLKEDWTLLGEEEWCCGSPNLLSGDEHGAKKYAEHNVSVLESRGVKKVITGCAGCFRVFKWEYPKLLGREPKFDVIHTVEYLRDVLTSGKLKADSAKLKVAYHDPCELSRLGGVLDAPREALRYLVGDFIEFSEHGVDVRCCGGGGLLQATNNDIRLAIAKRRLDEAVELGAEILTSACPACKLAFIDAARTFNVDIVVLDIMEIAANILGFL